MSKSNHRVAAGSKRARQLAAQNNRTRVKTALYAATPEQADWNARVDAEREAKKLAKLAAKDQQS